MNVSKYEGKASASIFLELSLVADIVRQKNVVFVAGLNQPHNSPSNQVGVTKCKRSSFS